jgi:hypothetical protein
MPTNEGHVPELASSHWMPEPGKIDWIYRRAVAS